ncbi:MAG TPA: hypothetical protein VFA77_14570, partial [Candidatus Eisenbacteria bacterium]|nr:hypothetical protein [Candidatus Eisenbacteria bacterium]
MTKVRLIGESKLHRDGFIGPTLCDELSGEATAQCAAPSAWCLAEAIREEPLQMTQGDRAES